MGAAGLLALLFQQSSMSSDADPAIAALLSELYEEQKAGYEKSQKLSNQFGTPLTADKPRIITPDNLSPIFDRKTVLAALKGGRCCICCSDDRVPHFTNDSDGRPWVKVGLPGSGALVPPKQRPAFFAFLRQLLGEDLQGTSHHECCGACNGDFTLATTVGNEAHHALGEQLPHHIIGYKKGDIRMTGDPRVHEGLGYVISGQHQFNVDALGIERHMHILASAFQDDRMLNDQVQALFSILLGHGWGKEGFAHHPLQVKVIGNSRDPRNTPERLWARLAPTRTWLHEIEVAFRHEHKSASKLFDIVVIDAPRANMKK
jgi:hypothetical protein